GVLPVPLSQLKSCAPVVRNAAIYHRAVALTYEQFRYSFTNAIDENEAHRLYDTYAVPGSSTFVFQGASANLNPWTEDRVDKKNPARGPLLLIAGEKDHTVTPAVVTAEYKLQQHHAAVTEFHEMPNRGHSRPLTAAA